MQIRIDCNINFDHHCLQQITFVIPMVSHHVLVLAVCLTSTGVRKTDANQNQLGTIQNDCIQHNSIELLHVLSIIY